VRGVEEETACGKHGLYIESLTEDGLPIPTEGILIKPIEIAA
jgi:hypothetical protein